MFIYSIKQLALAASALVFASPAVFGDVFVVKDNFAYASQTSLLASWQLVNKDDAFVSPAGISLTLANTMAVRDFGSVRKVPTTATWTLSCQVNQTSYKRRQLFGLFTADMLHGYLVCFDSSVATDWNGNGTYAIYKYDGATPFPNWDAPLGTPLVLAAGEQPALTSKPVNFALSATWIAPTRCRQLVLRVPNPNGTTTTLQASAFDNNTAPYTKIVLMGNSSGIFSDLALVVHDKPFNIRAYGAMGNGITDDTAAIKAAISDAVAQGGSVYIPATASSYIYSSCITIDGITVYGDGRGSLLQAKDPLHSAMILTGEHPCLNGVKISSPLAATIGRQVTPQSGGVMINKASDFILDNVSIDTTASVGIISLGGHGRAEFPGLISDCTISNTLADGIHCTQQSCFINEDHDTVTKSGDDMFAVVSYTRDGGLCHDINIIDNSGDGQKWGRGISVVGGANIKIVGNTISNTAGAGVYLQSELVRNPDGSLLYKTYGDNNIIVKNNSLNVLATAIFHGGINLGGRAADVRDVGQTETKDQLITDVEIIGNTITKSSHSGLSLQGCFNNIYVEGNRVDAVHDNGVDVFGGSNLFIGNSAGNTFSHIGGYGIYTGLNSYIPTYTSGNLYIENNIFSDTNMLGTFAIPIISIGSKDITGAIANNVFEEPSRNLISKPYIRYGTL